MPSDSTPLVFLLVFLVIGVEVGGILVFRTLTGIGPRSEKVLSFGIAGLFLAIALFLAHLQVSFTFVAVSLLISGLAQAWHLWLMCRRHWMEWRRRAGTKHRER